MLPKVMMEESKTDSGSASGTNTALWYQMNSRSTPGPIPFPTKSSTHSQKNCMISTISVIKKVAMKGPIKDLMTSMSNFFSKSFDWKKNNFNDARSKNTAF